MKVLCVKMVTNKKKGNEFCGLTNKIHQLSFKEMLEGNMGDNLRALTPSNDGIIS